MACATLAGPAHAETLQARGEMAVPAPKGQDLYSIEVVPLSKLAGKKITLAWKLEVQHAVSTDRRQSTLVLFLQYRVPEGAEMSSRLDIAFFDAQGRLLHTWETSEYTVRNTAADDPAHFPTHNVFEASDQYGLALADFDAIRSYQVVLRTTE
jgi:hypothetical protein